jgi:DNA-binding response OmpR family regulator
MTRKILLADDDESVRRMVARVLESAGYEVLLAGSVGEALEELRTGSPDLVLLDSELSHRADRDVCRKLRESHATVPMVVITSWPDQQEQSIREGPGALIEKPLDLHHLLELIRDLLCPPVGVRMG